MTDAVLTVRIEADNRKLIPAVRQADGSLQDLRKSAAAVGQQAAAAGTSGQRAMQQTASAAREARRETEGLATAAGGLRTRLLAVASGVGVAVLARQLASVADEYTNLSSKIDLVTDSEAAMLRVRSQVLSIAQLTRQDLTATGELYVRLTRATEALGLAETQRLRITETVNKAMVISGASAQEASAAIIQLSQGLASGALRGEEFNSVSEQAPILLDLLGRSLGKTRGELRAMAADGLLTAEVLTGALLEGSAEVDRQFGAMALTLSGASTQLGNAFTSYVGQLNESLGATQGMAQVISGISANFELIANVVLGAGVALGVRYVAAAGASVVATGRAAAASVALAEAQVIEARTAEAAAVAQLAHARTLNGTTTAQAALTAATLRTAEATAALTAAQVASTGALARAGAGMAALLGGPWGIAALVIGGVGAAIYSAMEAEEERQQAFDQGIESTMEFTRATREMVEALQDASAVAPPALGERLAQEASATQQLTARQRELAEARERYADALEAEAFFLASMGALGDDVMQMAARAEHVQRAKEEVDALTVAEQVLRDTTNALAEANQQALAPAIEATRARLAELNAESQGAGFSGLVQMARNAAEAFQTGLGVGENMAQSYRQAQAVAGALAADGAKAEQALATLGKTAAEVAQGQLTAWEAAARASGAFTEQQLSAERERLAAFVASVAAADQAQAASRNRGKRDQEATRAAAAAMRELEQQTKRVATGGQALQRILDRQAAYLGGPTVAAAKAYEAELREIAEAEADMLQLGPLRIEDVQALAEARAQAAAAYKKDLEEIEKAQDAEAARVEELIAAIGETPMDRLLRDIKLVDAALKEATDPERVAKLTNAMVVLQGALAEVNEATRTAFIDSTMQGLRSLQSMTENGSKAFAAMQVAIDAVSVAQAISAVLNQGQGDPYTAFARMAAMAAAVAQLVGNIGANFGGSNGFTDTAAQRQESQGTGTVLGDSEAKSESIANATQITADATTELVGINRSMLLALTRLQSGLDSAGGMLARGAGQVDYGAFDPGFMLNSRNGAAMGAAIGSVIPVIGTIMGAVLGAVLGSLLGGSSRITDEGVAISGGSLSDLDFQGYQERQTRSWRFGSRRTSTAFAPLADEFSSQFELIIDSITDTVRAGAEALGLLPADIEAALEAFRLAEIRISLKDLTPEEQQAELAAVFSSIFDGLAGEVVPFIAQFQRLGEGLGETLVRVATGVQVMREALDRLGFSLESAGPEQFAQISESLIELTGGLEEFIAGMTGFIDAFAPEGRKLELLQNDLTRAFAEAGLQLPTTREGMWALMQTLDATTESGREQIATLLRLSDTADAYYSMLEQSVESQRQAVEDQIAAVLEYERTAQALRDEVSEAGMSEFAIELRNINRWAEDAREELHAAARAAGLQSAAEEDLAAVHQIAAQRAAAAIGRLRAAASDLVAELYGTPLDQLTAEIERIEQAQQAASQAQIDGINAVGEAAENVYESQLAALQSIQEWLDAQRLGDLSTLTPEQRLAEARRQFETTLEAARGGDVDALGRITQLADALLSEGRDFWASGDPYTELESFVRGSLSGLVAAGPTAAPTATGGGFTGGGGTYSVAVSPELQALYEQRDALAAEQEDRRRQAMLAELGVMVRELIQATGDPLEEVASAIGLNLAQLAGDLGINLEELSGETARGLVNMARQLGVDVADLAEQVGVSLGSLGERQSLLNEALDATVNGLPVEFGDAVRGYLEAIRNATTEADATAAVEDAEAAINGMPPAIRDLLAPFFDSINPAEVVSELGTLRAISSTATAQLDALRLILGALEGFGEALEKPAPDPAGMVDPGKPAAAEVPAGETPPPLAGPGGGGQVYTPGAESALLQELRALRESSEQSQRAMLTRLESLEAAQREGADRIAAEHRRATDAAIGRR